MYQMGNFQSCKQSYDDLEKHINYLKRQNGRLQDKIEKLEKFGETHIANDLQSFFNNIDDKKIEELVDKILKHDSINFTLIPDEIEKQLYQNMIKLVLSVIQERVGSI